MSRWKSANRWLAARPVLILAAEVALLIFLWVLALASGRAVSYVFAIVWTVVVLVINPLQRLRSK